MLRIGLTGGVGSGKTIVAHCFADLGVPVIDTDQISRMLTEPAAPGYRAIVAQFGRDILDPHDQIDRRRLRQRVFADELARRTLEGALHPLIRAETEQRLARIDAPYCIVVVPLLFEAGFENLVDRVLVVDADEAAQIERVSARDGTSAQEVRAIISSQLPRAQRRQRADDILENTSTLEALRESVIRLHRHYLALTAARD